jgi:tRNA (adenine37-N6)-methyltransferase
MISLSAIGYVSCERKFHIVVDWGGVTSSIILINEISEEALVGLEEFSHVEIVFYMHGVDKSKVCYDARHPRENPAWPKVGIFAQRGSTRPNQIGVSIAKLIRREGRTLIVQGLDALDGTPVLDIKPVMREYLPREEVCQPKWVSEVLKDYY